MMTSNKLLKLSILSLAAVLFVGIGLWSRVRAFSGGPPPSHTNAPGESNCTSCHSSFDLNSGPGNVSINGLSAGYSPNQVMGLSVTTFHPDGFLYGFQLTAIDSTGTQAGTLAVTDATNTQLISGFVGGNPRQYIEQTLAGAFPVEFNQRTWTFMWTAPATNVGPVTFYVAGNGANGDNETTGDFIYTASATVPFQVFDLCIQDQTSGSLLQVNLATGEYLFTNCQGVAVGGTALVVKKGCQVTLQHNSTASRLFARINACAGTGTASLQVFSSARTFTIIDKDRLNSMCACQ